MPAKKPRKSSDVPYAKRYAIVMAGGIGSRFWPWSRSEMPKQLLALAGDQSMLADTVDRIRGIIPAENIFIVTGTKLRRGVAKAVPWIPKSGIMCEPTGRNTKFGITQIHRLEHYWRSILTVRANHCVVYDRHF